MVLAISGCQRSANHVRPAPPAVVLTIGLGGLEAAGDQFGARQVMRNQSIEPLIKYSEDGRPTPFLAEGWSLSDDGLRLGVRLKPTKLHDGSRLTSSDVAQSVRRILPRAFGPLYEDIADIDVSAEQELVLTFRRRSAFAVDALDNQVTKPESLTVGTGPFLAAQSEVSRDVELVANEQYHLGAPAIKRIALKPYQSTRAAWAGLLRGQVDMLYEVGVDAMDSLEPSSQVALYPFRRPYAVLGIFNMRRPVLKDASLRRALNAAVDRGRLISDALGGLGRAATGPVWPDHWANGDRPPEFTYSPRRLGLGKPRLTLTCIFPSTVSERFALLVKRQLQSIGADLALEALSLDEFAHRLSTSDYDVLLTEAVAGPGLVRPYLFWHSKGPYNYGGFKSAKVDAALDSIRYAENDDAYRAGVAAFQQAIVDDPPAIFLTWSERARAVSTRFDVPAEPGRDILSSIHLWRPTGRPPTATVH
jgi:peptide/nickel transport system substrate-binding protein